MRLILSSALLFALFAPGAFADSDAVVDAMIGVDPRNRGTSGTGAALDSVYGPSTQENATEEKLEEEWPDVSLKYGDDFKGLRSPLFDEEPANPDALKEIEDDINSSTVTTIPLGEPESREGVYYEDTPREKR